MPQFYIGLHTHRHGVSGYLFQVPQGDTMELSQFVEFLGEDYEADRDDEFLDLFPAAPATLEWLAAIRQIEADAEGST